MESGFLEPDFQLTLFGPGTTSTGTRSYRLYYQELRGAAFDRAGHVCERCATRGHHPWYRLYAHHRSYDNFGAETLADIEVLCPACHVRVHRANPRLERPPDPLANPRVGVPAGLTVATNNSNGGASGRRRITSEEVEEMVRLRERGWTQMQIGDKLGRNHRTVGRNLAQYRDINGLKKPMPKGTSLRRFTRQGLGGRLIRDGDRKVASGYVMQKDLVKSCRRTTRIRSGRSWTRAERRSG